MKKLWHLLAVVLLLLPFSAVLAQTDTIKIDFGSASNVTVSPWNNLTSGTGEGAILNLLNEKNLKTPMGVSVYDRFSGVNTTGTSTPDAAIGFPATSTADSYFGSNGDQPTGGMLFTGLDPAKTFTFKIMASRTSVTDIREAKYKFIGAVKDSVNLDASNNTANVAEITVTPAADGTIDLIVSPSENNTNSAGYYYLGALMMIYAEEAALPAAIEITAPNGGEELLVGNLYDLSWTNTNLTDDIELSYSADNGSTWNVITTVSPDVESYSWTVPTEASEQCLFKVTSGSVSDQSDAVFTIRSGNDVIMIDFGDKATVSADPWNNLTSTTGEGEIVNLKNSRNLKTPMSVSVYDRFTGINTGGTTTPDGSIAFPESATRDSYFGSTAEFSGTTQPTGSMLFTGLNPAKTYTFEVFASRSATDNREAKYKFIGAVKDSIYLNPSNNTSLVASLAVQPATDGTIDLVVSPGENNNNSSGFYYLGALKMTYDFEDVLPPAIELTTPNGGEQLFNGNLYDITWVNTNLVADIDLSYSTDNGLSWTAIETVSKSLETYSWTVPDDISDECLVKVSSGDVSDVSDAVFSMLSGNDMIMIDFGDASTASAAPWNNLTSTTGGGELTMLKNSRNLYTGIGVNVYDSFTGINTGGTTAPDAAVEVPVTAAQDNYYGNVTEWSGVIEPTGGMLFTGLNPDKTYTFKIFASRMSVSDNRETKYIFTGLVKDSVYLDAANNTANIAEFALQPAADGTIDLTVAPGENNTNSPYHFYYLGSLRMIYEFEDALPASLTVEAPNGNEVWVGGTTKTITWSSINVKEDISVSYSTDNGASWNAIATVASDQVSVDWTLPVLQSTECLVKVAAGSAEDVSDALFTIQDPSLGSITLVAPNGDENWLSGSDHMITWTSTALTEDIVIEFSSDNGSNWSDVATVAASDLSYDWTVPEVVSSECLVKITSGSFSDVSLSTFNVIEPVCTNTIVVLGSSTAYGSGATPIDSSWVNKYKKALKNIAQDYTVVNLALGGYTTFQILPTGTSMPDGITETIDVNRNLTKALTYNPYAIIINMPSNDATKNYGVDLQLDNYDIIVNEANANGIQVWIATTQPRNFSAASQIQIQVDMKDTLMAIYGDNCIDFWTGLADADGWIEDAYDSGDGVHLNNAGHDLIYHRVLDKAIETLACVEPDAVFPYYGNSDEISVFPNPFNDYSTIRFETLSAGTAEVRFFDLTGREVGVIEETIGFGGTHTINFTSGQIASSSSMLTGVLSIEDENGNRQYTFKIVHNK